MMRFKIFGVQVYVSFVFFAYITLLLLIDKTGLIIPVLMSNAIHEMGHATAMNKVNSKIIKITLKPGGCIMTVLPFKSKKEEIIVALFGPMFNLIFAIAFTAIWLIFNVQGCFVAAVINAGLGFFNLLPINGLDASTVLYALLSPKKLLTYKLINIITSFVFGAICIIFTVVNGINPSMLVVVVYLICCAVFKI